MPSLPYSLIILWPYVVPAVGAILGSFANVVIHRLPRGEHLAWPGSHCPHCEHRLAPWDNVPLLSFLFLRGRCRYCAARINSRYFIVELITTVVFAAVAVIFPLADTWLGVPLLVVAFLLIVTLAIWWEGHPPMPVLTLPMLFAACASLVIVASTMLPGTYFLGLGAGMGGALIAPLVSRQRPALGLIGLGGTLGLLAGLLGSFVMMLAS